MSVYRLGGAHNAKAGEHWEGTGPDKKGPYVHGDIVESDRDLMAIFPNKFEYAPPGSVDKFTALEEKKGKKESKKQTDQPEVPVDADGEEIYRTGSSDTTSSERRKGAHRQESADDLERDKVKKAAKSLEGDEDEDVQDGKAKAQKSIKEHQAADEDESDDEEEAEVRTKKSKKKKKKAKVSVKHREDDDE